MSGRSEGRIPSATWRGMPCLQNIRETNASATSGAVTVSVVGMKNTFLGHAVDNHQDSGKPLDVGNCSIKSILIACHGRPGTCKGCSKP